jgi:hypothetical protein
MAAKWQQNGRNSTKFPGFPARWQQNGNKMEKRKWRGEECRENKGSTDWKVDGGKMLRRKEEDNKKQPNFNSNRQVR